MINNVKYGIGTFMYIMFNRLAAVQQACGQIVLSHQNLSIMDHCYSDNVQ